MTSVDLGIEPAGISSEFSWTRSLCQSTKMDRDVSRGKSERLSHRGLEHMLGAV